MKTTGQCPKCSSTDLIVDAFLRDQGLYSNQRLQLITFKDPDAAFDKEPVMGSLKATVCTACGYTELYASNPSALREALPASRAIEQKRNLPK